MQQYFRQSKSRIQAVLDKELAQMRPELGAINSWGDGIAGRLMTFASQGKMLRGGLVCLSAEMFGRPADEEVYIAAAALELFQAGLLIHDDIMDGDQIRRGQPTMWMQYQQPFSRSGKSAALVSPGVSLALCVGDAAFFIAMNLAARSGVVKVGQLMGQELTRVCVAQMADVAWAEDQNVPTEDEIVAMYMHKTAGYSLVLPLTIGALLAGQSDQQLDYLGELGQHLGLMFQLKDDELGIWGNSQATGKPVGADVSEGKKTLYYRWLVDRMGKADRVRLATLFGSHQPIATQDLEWLRQLLINLGVTSDMDAKIRMLADQAYQVLAKLQIADEYRALMSEFIAYCQERRG